MKRTVVLLVLGAGVSGYGCAEPNETVTRAAQPLIFEEGAPQTLSATGLYANLANRQLAEGVVEFKPRYPLWTDGAEKRRFIKLPAGSQIETSDMDHWRFPAGTRLWKEFARGGVLLETRFVEIGIGPPGTEFMAAYVWDADGQEARLAVNGADNVNGTDHQVPSADQCGSCHRGDPGLVLGFSAIQLSKPEGEGPTLTSIAAAGWLTAAPPMGVDYPIPGDERTASAMGVLHGNCGHCHNTYGVVHDGFDMTLRLSVTEGDARETALWRTTVGRDTQVWRSEGVPQRIVPGNPAASAIVFRMASREERTQMPRLGTKHVDEAGLATVRAWIESLADGGTAPAPMPMPMPEPMPAPGGGGTTSPPAPEPMPPTTGGAPLPPPGPTDPLPPDVDGAPGNGAPEQPGNAGGGGGVNRVDEKPPRRRRWGHRRG